MSTMRTTCCHTSSEQSPDCCVVSKKVESLYGADGEVVFWRGTEVGEEWRDVTEIRIPIAKVKHLLATMQRVADGFAAGGN